MARLVYLIVSALALGLAQAEDLLSCGDARYLPSEYTCYEGNFLCPKINGDPTLKCGNACYLPGMYSCDNYQLKLLPRYEGVLSLVASNPYSNFHRKAIQACSRHFYIGIDGPCTYCPQSVPREACPQSNETIIYPGSSLAVIVPGGQQYYVEPNGALGFTQAHSIAYPPGSIFGGTAAYQNGIFTAPQGSSWFACPVADRPNQYQVFAQLPGVTLSSDCVGFNAYVKAQPQGTYGAWQYT